MPTEQTRRWRTLVGALLCLSSLLSGCAGCSDEGTPDDGDADETLSDSGPTDAPSTVDTAGKRDSGGFDTTSLDTTPTETAPDVTSLETGTTDATPDAPVDSGPSDAIDGGDATDTAPGDTDRSELDAVSETGDSSLDTAETSLDTGDSSLDATSDTAPDTSPAGLSVPCSNGSGWTVFKFHWSQNSGSSPSIDVWDASCNYSLAPQSTCRVSLVNNPSFNSSQPKAVLLTGAEVLRVRYDVSTLQFTDASVHVQARSYSTTASTTFDVWSPIYGANTSPNRVDNDFVYDWYRVPWSNYLSPNDDPALTAIEISDNGGDELAVHAVELCVE